MKRAAVDESPTEMAWDGIRRGEPGTTLPLTFPARTELLAAGYLVVEEVDGADETELTNAGLSPQQATAVIAATESLT
jgi:hypothetical protein